MADKISRIQISNRTVVQCVASLWCALVVCFFWFGFFDFCFCFVEFTVLAVFIYLFEYELQMISIMCITYNNDSVCCVYGLLLMVKTRFRLCTLHGHTFAEYLHRIAHSQRVRSISIVRCTGKIQNEAKVERTFYSVCIMLCVDVSGTASMMQHCICSAHASIVLQSCPTARRAVRGGRGERIKL